MKCNLINEIKLKNREAKKEPSREPYAQNPLYQKNVCVGCELCNREHPGRNKNFRTLWKLYMHYKTHHNLEINSHKDDIVKLADFIHRGVLL